MAQKKRGLLYLLLSLTAAALAVNLAIVSAQPEWYGPARTACVLLNTAALACCLGMLAYVGVQEGRAEAAIQQTLRIDALTGLLNRDGFKWALGRLLAGARDGEYTLVDFDIGSFERFNSLYGHESGDEVLTHIADVLKAKCGKGEAFARLEADHFVGLIRSGSIAAAVARVEAFDKAIRPLKRGVTVLISYGIYWIEDNREPLDVVWDRATAAKRAVKGNYEQFIGVYDKALHRRQMEDSELVGQMEGGLTNGEFVAYYQPKYDTFTERIVGAEALVRWKRPGGEVTPPDRFIRLFEEKGLITRLDWYMFEQVCRQLPELAKMGVESVPVSVNFSRAHLYDERFFEKLDGIVNRYGVSPQLLEIEMTETMFLDDREKLSGMMTALHERGYQISIDDFGSGYSSLNMLKDSCFDIVKLDRGFMDQSTSERGRIIIEGILSMSQKLNMRTVAEGVTSREQLEFLRTNGCDIIQGYYFSRPVDAAAFTQILRDRQPAVCPAH